MVPEEITLDHPAVQAAKKRWDDPLHQVQRKHTATFEELFEYFKQPASSHIAIAEKLALSRERVRQLYETYFQEIFGISAQDRRDEYTREILKHHPRMKVVAAQASEAGCLFQLIPVRADKRILPCRSSALVNGHLCSVHFARTDARMKKSHTYGRIHVPTETLYSVYALICHVSVKGLPERTFILPAQDIRIAYGVLRDQKSHSLYLPFDRPIHLKSARPKIDYWKYENAWKLLAPKIHETVSEEGVVQ
jgi:hypothetical protein